MCRVRSSPSLELVLELLDRWDLNQLASLLIHLSLDVEVSSSLQHAHN